MPLKIVCRHCGEPMYETTGYHTRRYRTDSNQSNLIELCVPAIVDLKLNFKCPGCKRTITNRDLEEWTIKISDARKQC